MVWPARPPPGWRAPLSDEPGQDLPPVPAAPPVTKPGWKRGRHHPWAKIDQEYIEGVEIDGEPVYPTSKHLGEKYGVPYRTMLDRSKKHDWIARRAAYKEQLARELRLARILRRVKEADQVDSANLAVGRWLVNQLARRGQDSTKAGSALSTHELDKMASALLKAQLAEHRALGRPADLLEEADTAERKRDDALNKDVAAMTALDRAMADLLDAPPEKYQATLEKILGPTPAAARGKVIDIKALRKRLNPPPDGPDDAPAGLPAPKPTNPAPVTAAAALGGDKTAPDSR